MASDVIQLSAQRVVMVDSMDDVVADVAFGMVSDGHGHAPPTVRMVRLLSPAQVEAMAMRRQQLIDGDEPPKWPPSTRHCQGCGHRDARRSAGNSRSGGTPRG